MKSRLPADWNEDKIKTVLEHYETQSADAAVVEDKATLAVEETLIFKRVSSFHPSKFPPTSLQTSEFVARPLHAVDAEVDFEAYMSSPKTIKNHSAGRWKTLGFTLQENLALLQQHERKHRNREEFAFLLWSQVRQKSLGCVYLLPLLKHCERADEHGYDEQAAMVTFWTRDDCSEPEFSKHLVAALRDWLTERWRFSGFVFRINKHESMSKQALERNGFQMIFEVENNAQPKMLFYNTTS